MWLFRKQECIPTEQGKMLLRKGLRNFKIKPTQRSSQWQKDQYALWVYKLYEYYFCKQE